MRLAYLIPEFPGQTHTFFWREKNALEELAITVCLFSTRKPRAEIISHEWAQTAIVQTLYLFPPSLSDILRAGLRLVRSGPKAWAHLLASIARTDLPLRNLPRLCGLVLPAALFADHILREHIDHIHVHMCSDAANIALFAHLLTGVPYSMTLHESLDVFGGNQPEKWRHAAFAVIITQTLRADVEKRLAGYLPATLAVAPMGVDLDRFQRSQPYTPYRRPETALIFSCGRLNPSKGHADLIRAVAQLVENGYDIKLHIAGEDDSGTGMHVTELMELTHDLGMTERVVFLRAVPETTVREELDKAHIFALASWHEALGVVYMEAMAMGVPVIGTRAGGVPELIQDHINGLLVPPQAPEALAYALQSVLDEPDLALRLGEAGKNTVVREFHSKRSADVLAQHIRQIHQKIAPA